MRFDAADAPETAFVWRGPAGAHHVTVDTSEHVHEYTTEVTRTISVFDAANTLLGEIVDGYWD
ncbi:MAG TPA: hypothetical protein VGO62_13550 [Myxococcota bacterium]